MSEVDNSMQAPSKEEQVHATLELIFKFYCSRPESKLRQVDMWKLVKDRYENEPIVSYWRSINKENHGIAPDVRDKLVEDRRFTITKCGPREVYVELSFANKVLLATTIKVKTGGPANHLVSDEPRLNVIDHKTEAFNKLRARVGELEADRIFEEEVNDT